jgi:hypothetical protein
MRTKALVLAAAFAAVGVATSVAQVYSVNAVGYVNKTIKPGYNLVSNPLNAANNTIASLFSNFQGGVVNGTAVFKFVNGNFISARYDDFDGAYGGAAATETTLPGDGVYVFLPGTVDKVVTFVGEVVQGNTTTPLPRGFSIKSSVVPQAVKPDALGAGSLPAANGDVFYRYNPVTKGFASSRFDDFDGIWNPPLPTIDVGEAFFYFRAGAAANWTRTFSVNNPS